MVYRTREEEGRWRERDPLRLCREKLLADGAGEKELKEIEGRAQARIADAYQQALAAPEPGAEQVVVSPYKEGGAT